MIARLLKAGGVMLVYFCAATVIAELLVVGCLWFNWRPNREKYLQSLAIAQGIDLFKMKEELDRRRQDLSPEEPSYNQVIRARAEMDKNLALREQALANRLGHLLLQQRQLAEETKRYKLEKAAFRTELATLTEGLEAGRQADVRTWLTKMKPKQAKEQLMLMLDSGEMDEVVLLLVGMPTANQAKIGGECKTPEESEKLGEILRKIREGVPQSQLLAKAQEILEKPNPTTPE